MRKVLKITGICVGCIIGLFVLVWGGLNILKFPIYGHYYSVKEDVCLNPGLGDGFVCQGICVSDDESTIFVSGYMTDKSASRIYVTNRNNESYYVSLTLDGKAFTGHVGGIAVVGDRLYMSCNSKLHTVSMADVLNAESGDEVEILDQIEINNAGSYLYATDTHLYVGEFHDGGAYVTDHPYDTSDGTNHAIVSRYPIGDLSKPDRIYSVRDKVQGICFTPSGRVVLSTSYGLTSSMYYVYNEADAEFLGEYLDGAPVYALVGCETELSGPAMAEGLDYYDGKVITLTESASNKYIFGKFFFAFNIVALDILG